MCLKKKKEKGRKTLQDLKVHPVLSKKDAVLQRNKTKLPKFSFQIHNRILPVTQQASVNYFLDDVRPG